jgi:hypothetical protein
MFGEAPGRRTFKVCHRIFHQKHMHGTRKYVPRGLAKKRLLLPPSLTFLASMNYPRTELQTPVSLRSPKHRQVACNDRSVCIVSATYQKGQSRECFLPPRKAFQPAHVSFSVYDTHGFTDEMRDLVDRSSSGIDPIYMARSLSTPNFFLHFYPLNFANIYGPQKDLQNYTSSVVGDGGRDLPPCPTEVGARAVK